METAIDIRPLAAADRPAFAGFFERLSDRTRYLRFFAPVPTLPRRMLDWMVDVDQRRHGAIGAWDHDELIGEARYVAVDDDSAEVALTVRDDQQRRGVGKALLAALTMQAFGNGFCRLTAETLAQNEGIRRLLTAAGFARTGVGAGTTEWERNSCPSVAAV